MKLEDAEKIFAEVKMNGDDVAISESLMLEAYDTIIDAKDEQLAEKDRSIAELEKQRDEARRDAVETARLCFKYAMQEMTRNDIKPLMNRDTSEENRLCEMHRNNAKTTKQIIAKYKETK